MKQLLVLYLVLLPWMPVWAQTTDPDKKPAVAAPPNAVASGSVVIQGPEKGEPYRLLKYTAEGVPDTAHLNWEVIMVNPDKDKDPSAIADIDDNNKKMQFVAPPGKYIIRVVCFVGGEKSKGEYAVLIGPRPPAPPTPGPVDPNPPTPDPGPGPAPIGDGLRVLILEETEDLFKLPKEQVNALDSGVAAAFLSANCEKGKDNVPEWRRWDDDLADDQIALAAENWQKAFKDAVKDSKGVRPWVIVSNPRMKAVNGAEGYAGPFPKNNAEWMSLLEKWKTK